MAGEGEGKLDVSRRSLLKAGLAAAAAGASGCLSEGGPAAAGAAAAKSNRRGKLNVISIILHDSGQEFGCYGKPVKTPGLDALAAEGVVFTNHFCNSTPCSPARGALMTGQFAHHNGLIGLVNKGWDIPHHKLTIVDHFNNAGYETVRCGLQHERHPKDRRAMRYQKTFSTRGHKDPEKRQISVERVTAAAKGYLEGRKASDKPFYLNMGIFENHAPWSRRCYKPFMPDPAKAELPAFLPDIAPIRKQWAAFLGALLYTDKTLGEFFEFLTTSGIDKDTLVIFTVDHGVSFPRAKTTCYEAGMETALVMKLPGAIKAGAKLDQMVSHVDLMPTILDACGLPAVENVDGRSFWALLTGGEYEPNKYIYTERNFHEDYDPMRSVRDERYKYIRNFSARPDRLTVAECEAMDSKTRVNLWLARSKRPRSLEELYDLANDPHETVNLADQAELARVKKRLRDELFRWMNATGDYLAGADQDEAILDMARQIRWTVGDDKLPARRGGRK